MQNTISTFWSNPSIHNIIILGILIVLILAARTYILKKTLERINEPHQRRRLKKLSGFGAIGLIILLGVILFGSNLTGLTVSLGVASAAIAFALQELLSSAVAYLQITFGKVFNVGDRIKIGGVTGDVISSNLFLTTLMEIGGDWVSADQYSGRVVRVANSQIYKQPIYNYSGDFSYLWDEIKIPVKYGSDRKLARSILQKCVAKVTSTEIEKVKEHWGKLQENFAIENAVIDPKVFLFANDNWLEYSVRYIVHYRFRRSIKNDLFESILSEFDAHPEKVGIASGTYDIVGLPEIKVQLQPAVDLSKSQKNATIKKK